MAWNPGTIQTLLDTAQYNLGRVGMIPIRAIINAAVENQPSFNQGDPIMSSAVDATSTAQTLRSSAGRFYYFRITNTSTSAINVVFTDGGNTIIVGGATVPAVIAAVAGVSAAIPGVTEGAIFGSPQGAGQAILTDLRVRAFLSLDGTTPAAAGVTVFALTSV